MGTRGGGGGGGGGDGEHYIELEDALERNSDMRDRVSTT